MFHAAIEVCKPGDVLVVATHSDSTDGFFGELLATSCQAHGIKGDGDSCGRPRCRGFDRHAGIPGILTGHFRAGNRERNSRLREYRHRVRRRSGSPGRRYCLAMVNGVVVVPRQHAAEVVTLCEARLAKEAKSRERLKAGELGRTCMGFVRS